MNNECWSLFVNKKINKKGPENDSYIPDPCVLFGVCVIAFLFKNAKRVIY